MRLYSNIQGNPSKQSIILLHGLFGSNDNLGIIQRYLVSKNYYTHGIDLRNHGNSPWSTTMNYEIMAHDVINYIHEHDLSDTIILGHSMGGKVAMQALLTEPKLFEKAIVLDIAPTNYPPSFFHKIIFSGLSSLPLEKIKTRKEADTHLSTFIDNKTIRQFLLKNLIKDNNHKFILKINLISIIKNYQNILSELIPEKKSNHPILFLTGENSPYVKPEHHKIIAKIFHNHIITTIPKTNHWLHYESPGLVCKEIYRHINTAT